MKLQRCMVVWIMNKNKSEKEIELIQKSIQLIEREQTFLIGLLQKF